MEKLQVVKKTGFINKEGEIIVPIEYKEVIQLDSGLLIGERNSVEIKKDKLTVRKFYHYREVKPAEDKSRYHFYTLKGKLDFMEPIMDYRCDKEGNLVAVKSLDEWILVKVDWSNNRIVSVVKGIESLLDVNYGLVNCKKNDMLELIYSIKEEKVVLERENGTYEFIEDEMGIKLLIDKRQGLYNLKGEEVLKCQWDEIICRENFIIVKKNKRLGVYSYEGKEIVPCEATNMTYIEFPVDGELVPMVRLIKSVNEDKYYALITLDGQVIKPYDKNTIYVEKYYDKNAISEETGGIVILEKEKGEVFCQIKRIDGKLVLNEVFIADKISPLYNDGRPLFKVYVGKYVGLYDMLGKEILPIVYKDLYLNNNSDECVVLGRGLVKKYIKIKK